MLVVGKLKTCKNQQFFTYNTEYNIIQRQRRFTQQVSSGQQNNK